MQPLVTVVIPTYNSARFIRDVLESVLAQTYPNIEIIVMDGASKDGTADIAREVAPNAIVISEPDRGQTHAINKGWTMAKGDILTWLCADDGYYPDTVANAVIYLNAHPDAMWVYGVVDHLDVDGNQSPVRVPPWEWDYHQLVNKGNNIGQAASFLRRSLLVTEGLPNEELHYGMDYEYWLRIGKNNPGHWVPSVRAYAKYYQEAKTQAGQAIRLLEFKSIAMQYGAGDLPSWMRWEWTQAYILELVNHLRRGKFQHLLGDMREIFRYPVTFPRGMFKMLFRSIVPAKIETKLRQWFVSQPPQTLLNTADRRVIRK